MYQAYQTKGDRDKIEIPAINIRQLNNISDPGRTAIQANDIYKGQQRQEKNIVKVSPSEDVTKASESSPRKEDVIIPASKLSNNVAPRNNFGQVPNTSGFVDNFGQVRATPHPVQSFTQPRIEQVRETTHSLPPQSPPPPTPFSYSSSNANDEKNSYFKFENLVASDLDRQSVGDTSVQDRDIPMEDVASQNDDDGASTSFQDNDTGAAANLSQHSSLTHAPIATTSPLLRTKETKSVWDFQRRRRRNAVTGRLNAAAAGERKNEEVIGRRLSPPNVVIGASLVTAPFKVGRDMEENGMQMQAEHLKSKRKRRATFSEEEEKLGVGKSTQTDVVESLSRNTNAHTQTLPVVHLQKQTQTRKPILTSENVSSTSFAGVRQPTYVEMGTQTQKRENNLTSVLHPSINIKGKPQIVHSERGTQTFSPPKITYSEIGTQTVVPKNNVTTQTPVAEKSEMETQTPVATQSQTSTQTRIPKLSVANNESISYVPKVKEVLIPSKLSHLPILNLGNDNDMMETLHSQPTSISVPVTIKPSWKFKKTKEYVALKSIKRNPPKVTYETKKKKHALKTLRFATKNKLKKKIEKKQNKKVAAREKSTRTKKPPNKFSPENINKKKAVPRKKANLVKRQLHFEDDEAMTSESDVSDEDSMDVKKTKVRKVKRKSQAMKNYEQVKEEEKKLPKWLSTRAMEKMRQQNSKNYSKTKKVKK